MLFELIAAVVAGVAVGGIVSGLRWASRGWLPKWLVPASAGVALFAYAVWSEYSWFERMTSVLPKSVVVIWKNEDQSFWRPWSYHTPVINRFTAIDVGAIKRNPAQPDLVMTDVILAGRWRTNTVVKTVFDCKELKRAVITDVSVLANDGTLQGLDWTTVPADDLALTTVCTAR